MMRRQIECAVYEFEIVHTTRYRAFNFICDRVRIEETIARSFDSTVGAVAAFEGATAFRLEWISRVATQVRLEILHPLIKARCRQARHIGDAERCVTGFVR